MFHLLIGGPLDPVAAGFAMVALFSMITIVVTSLVVKRRSRLEVINEFELAKIKERDNARLGEQREQQAHEINLAKIASNREIEFKRIDSGMIELQPVKPTRHPEEG